MSRLEDVAYKPATNSQVATATNAAAVATVPAPTASTGKRLYVSGYTISYSVAVAAATTFDIVSGAVVVTRVQIPAAAFPSDGSTVEFERPFECPPETSAVGTLGAGGAANVGTCVIRYFTA